MAVESSKETTEDQVEPLIDELIRDILGDAGGSTESMRGKATTAALFESAMGSMRGGTSRVSMLERLLVAEVFASELAEALAPALADQLAPRLVKAMETLMTGEAGKKPASAASSRASARSRETKLATGPKSSPLV